MAATKKRQDSKRHRDKRRRRGGRSGGTQAPQTHAQIIAAAAKKWHVPLWVMYGVWGMETTFGTGGTSSAGAEGAFQFIPSTAAAYGVDVNSFASSANGAAHYLHDLKKSTGSWNGAIEGYGGGYNAGDVKAKAREKGITPQNSSRKSKTILADIELPIGPDIPFPGPNVNPAAPFLGPAEALGGGSLLSAPGELLQASTAVTALISALLDIHFWIRVGMALAAFILLYMGLQALTGQGPSAGDVARRGAEGAAAVAAVK